MLFWGLGFRAILRLHTEPSLLGIAHSPRLNYAGFLSFLFQLVFPLISPGRVVPNLVAGAIAEAGAQQAGDMMQVSGGEQGEWGGW